MESLRGAADKIKKSPRLVRKKINNALHKESKFLIKLYRDVFT